MAKSLSASTLSVPNGSTTPKVVSFNADPTAVLTGVAAPAGSLGIRTDTPSVYVKTSPLSGPDTGWVVLPPGTSALAAIAYSGSANDLVAGTVPAAQMPAFTGDVTSAAGTVATTIISGAVTNAKLRNSAGTSVIGRSANSTGAPADIVATADGQVLQRSSGALAFTSLVTPLYDYVNDFTFTTFDDVNLGTLGQRSFLRCVISSNGNTITGIANGVNGLVVTLYRNDSTTAWTQQLMDASHISNPSIAANRILLPNVSTFLYYAQQSVTLRYDGTLSRWLLLSNVGP
jgi:hypothetical protein